LPRILAGLQRLLRLQHLLVRDPKTVIRPDLRAGQPNLRPRRKLFAIRSGVADFAFLLIAKQQSEQSGFYQRSWTLALPPTGSPQGSRMNPLARPCSIGFSARPC